MKKTTSSKTTKATTRRSKAVRKETPVIEPENIQDIESDEVDDGYIETVSTKPRSSTRKLFITGIILAILALGAYRYRYLLTPVVVNGQPVYVWEYFSKLHQQYGREQLNSMATESMIRQAVAKATISVPKEEIDSEMSAIENEASASGGLSAILESQRISLEELRGRVELQLAVKKILSDKIKVSDQEVNDAYSKNKDFYKGMTEAAAKEMIKSQLEDQKFQNEVSVWLQGIRQDSKIDIKFPGI